MKLISKINKCKLGSSSKMQFVLFYPKTIQKQCAKFQVSNFKFWHRCFPKNFGKFLQHVYFVEPVRSVASRNGCTKTSN